MQRNNNGQKENEPFIKSPANGLMAMFWGILFLGIVGSVGQGSLELNISRLALIGLVVAGIARWNRKISGKTFLVSGVTLWTIMLIFSILSNPAVAMLTILIPVIIGMSILVKRWGMA